MKYLGVYLDDKLNWTLYIKHLSLQLARYSGLFYRIRNLIPNHILLTLYYSLVYCRIQYGIILWGSTFKSVLRELEVRLNNILRTILVVENLTMLHSFSNNWNYLNYMISINWNRGKFMYQLNWNKLPIIIQSLFTKIEDLHKYNMRQAKTTKLFLPKVSKQMDENSIIVRGSQPGVSERRKSKEGRGSFLKGTLNTARTVHSLPPTLLSFTVKQLNTSTKPECWVYRINTKK